MFVGAVFAGKEKTWVGSQAFLLSSGIPKGPPLVEEERKVRAAKLEGPLLSRVFEGIQGDSLDEMGKLALLS